MMKSDNITILKPLYPWFGGKGAVAEVIWEALGNPAHVIDPFFGSGAVHLARPHPPGLETFNDADHWVVNYLRAVRLDPEAVCHWATGPVLEADLHARHRWLVDNDRFRERMVTEPDYCDAQVAGWWLHGICAWIGSGWCTELHQKRITLGHGGRGIHRLSQQRPQLCTAGQGINRLGQKRHQLTKYGNGMHSPQRTLQADLKALAQRLERVRTCYGDWTRVCTPAVLNALEKQSLGILLDPPYSKILRNDRLYNTDTNPAPAVAAWARSIQNRPNTRLVLCGYVGEHDMPGWATYHWKANGGLGNQGSGRGRANARQECLWFSPQCELQQLRLL